MTEQQSCKDLPEVELPTGDMLSIMLASQLDFQASLDDQFLGITEIFSSPLGDGAQTILPSLQSIWAEKMSYNILASHAELTELLEWIPWKNWKTYGPMTEDSIIEARYEAIDILHFVMNMMMLLGMTPDMIFDMFMRKQEENRNRQKRGY